MGDPQAEVTIGDLTRREYEYRKQANHPIHPQSSLEERTIDSLAVTRPDTRPSVADGWAGAEMRVFPLFNSITTDRPTNGRTDKASYRVACPQLKM